MTRCEVEIDLPNGDVIGSTWYTADITPTDTFAWVWWGISRQIIQRLRSPKPAWMRRRHSQKFMDKISE